MMLQQAAGGRYSGPIPIQSPTGSATSGSAHSQQTTSTASSTRHTTSSVAMVQQQQHQSSLSGNGHHHRNHHTTTTTFSSSSDSANNNHLKTSCGPSATSAVPPNSSSVVTVSSVASTATPTPSTASTLPTSPIVYGELIILGYNGSLPQGEKGRRRSKYQLMRRLSPNGIKKSKHYSVKQPQSSKAIQDKEQHSISFTLSRSQAIIVEYQHDEETDMFQIGRSSESPIDFVVIDTLMLDPNKGASASHNVTRSPYSNGSNGHSHHHNNGSNGHHNHAHQQHNSSSISEHQAASSTASNLPPGLLTSTKTVQQSTISRFACRILVDRRPPYCARIYAAGFDSSKNIFLGEKATKWQTNGEIDGLTTNGILIMHPKRPFVGRRGSASKQGDKTEDRAAAAGDLDMQLMFESLDIGSNPTANVGGVWREVSVCGEIYSVRETRSASQKGVKIEAETNVLQDGTLIDLCGATLMWRSADGLGLSPTKGHLEEMIDALNASRPQCPVGLNTLVIPRKSGMSSANLAADEKQPWVYLNCGHVQGYHDWGHVREPSGKDGGKGGCGAGARTCPMCFKSGPVVRLTMGIEPSFWSSSATPSYAFNPCGHMASEMTTRYWSQVLIPHGTNGFHAMCPFCATPLGGESGYVKLIFQ